MLSPDGKLSLAVIVDSVATREYRHEGSVFVEGRPGDEYTLRVCNWSHRRALVILSVDGLSVMTGQRASQNGSGYILEPESHLDVPGWRLDDQDVAHFLFDTLPEAYASKMGKPENIGVIGAAFYYERPHYRYPLLENTRGDFGPLLGGTKGSIGTGFGRQTEHEVTRVRFYREEHRAALLTLRYDTAENLRAIGINVGGRNQSSPNPFPADGPGPGCPPPKGWRE